MKTETYKTKDLPLACALLTENLTLLNIEKKGSTCWFIFDDSKQCEKIVNNYYFGNLMVNARSYQDNLKRLKTLIFQ